MEWGRDGPGRPQHVIRHPHRATAAEKRERAAEMHRWYTERRMSLEEVGLAFGVSGARVHQIFKEHGFATRGK